jgi:hypothetical protein
MITYHALDGMRIVSSTQELVNSILFIMNNPECEICCSNEEGTEQYGDIAIAVEGHISHMFECDVISKVGADGKRYATKYSEYECSKECFLEQCMPEAWVSHTTIKYIRIKEYAGRRYKRHYTDRYDMALLESLNIPIVTV